MGNKGQGRTTLADKNSDLSQVPLEDVLESRAEEYLQTCWGIPTENEKHAVGVMLTGMGNDGSEGMLEMKRAGAVNIAQNEQTCVVFGMPKEAMAIGAVDYIVPLPQIAGQMLRYGRSVEADSPYVRVPRQAGGWK